MTRPVATATRCYRFTINTFQLPGRTKGRTILKIFPGCSESFPVHHALSHTIPAVWLTANSSPKIKWNSGMILTMMSHLTRQTTYLTTGWYTSRPTLRTGDSIISSKLWTIWDQLSTPEEGGILRSGETKTALSLKQSKSPPSKKKITKQIVTTTFMLIINLPYYIANPVAFVRRTVTDYFAKALKLDST